MDDCRSVCLLTQLLVDVPCAELARELHQSCAAVQGLQNALQQVLDQREEARQSRQLLQLYLQALEKEGGILSGQEGRTPEGGTSCVGPGRLPCESRAAHWALQPELPTPRTWCFLLPA